MPRSKPVAKKKQPSTELLPTKTAEFKRKLKEKNDKVDAKFRHKLGKVMKQKGDVLDISTNKVEKAGKLRDKIKKQKKKSLTHKMYGGPQARRYRALHPNADPEENYIPG